MVTDKVIYAILLRNVIIVSQVVCQVEAKYQLMVKTESWPSALLRCSSISGTFLPDIGTDEIIDKLLDNMDEHEMVWLYGKEIALKYSRRNSDIYKYVEMSFRPQSARLQHYLCTTGDLNSALPNGQYTWKMADVLCRKKRGNLYNISSPKQLRSTMPYLLEDKTYWVDIYTNLSLPVMELDTHGISELCIGIIKEDKKSFSYRTADCNMEFKYFCDVSTNNGQIYAPTIKRRSEKLPSFGDELVTESGIPPQGLNNPSDLSSGETSKTPSIGLIVGPAVVGVALLVVGVVVVVVVQKRKSQARYQRRWNRYRVERQKRNGSSLRSRDIHHIETDGTLDSLVSNKHSVILGMNKEGKYVHLRESETLKGQGEGRHSERDNMAHNIDQPGYYIMEMNRKPMYINKKAANEVVMSYETFDPDPVQFKEQIKNRHTGKVQIKLTSDLKISADPGNSKTPLKPLNKKHQEQEHINELYEQPLSSGKGKPPPLPIKKFKGPVYLDKAKKEVEKHKSAGVTTIPAQKEDKRLQEAELYATKHMGDLDHQAEELNLHQENACKKSSVSITQNVQPTLDDLGVYESYEQDQVTQSSPANDHPRLDDLDPYENSALATTDCPLQNVQTLDDLDPYENSVLATTDSPLKNVQTLDDLDPYENFDQLKKSDTTEDTSNTQTLDELDQYENFASPTTTKKELGGKPVQLKDLDDYENYPLCSMKINA